MTDTFDHASRSGFIERLGRLAGQTTWREPGGGNGTSYVARQLSSENAMVLALSMSRRHPNDIGPDVAYSVGTGVPHHRQRVVEWLADKLRRGTGPAGKRAERQLLAISGQAYDIVIGSRDRAIAPKGAVAEFTILANVGAGWLWIAMESAVERAERAMHSRNEDILEPAY